MQIGTIKRLVRDKGFGFVRTHDGREWFFHRTETPQWDLLDEGTKVSFQESVSTKGLRAVGVQLVQA